MKHFHYAWVICLASFWLFLCNIGLCSTILSVYLPFIEATGISGSVGSAILSVRCLFSVLVLFVVNRLYLRMSLRTGILLFTLIGAAAPLLFFVGGGPASYFAGAALAGIAYGGGSTFPVSLLIKNWFHGRRGLAVGISSAGSGIAGMLVAPYLTSVILKHSLKSAFLVHAAFMVVSALVIFLLIHDSPEDMAMAPYTNGEEAVQARRHRDVRPLSGFMMGLLAIMMLLNGGAALGFSGHLTILTISCSYSAETAARIFSMFGLTLTIAKLISGRLADSFGARNCSLFLIVLYIAGALCVLGMDGVVLWWAVALAALMGFGSAVFNVGPTLWAAELSPSRQYAGTVRWLQLFYNVGGIVFTSVPGIIADHTGEYKSSFLLFAAMMVVSACILVYVYRQADAAEEVGSEASAGAMGTR